MPNRSTSARRAAGSPSLSPLSWLRALSPRALPPMQRSNYRWEMLASFFLPFLLAAIEGGVLAVIVRNAFEGVVSNTALNFAVGLISAAPAFANITSFVWARLAHGRPKLRLINLLQIGLIIGLLVIAASPQTPLGLVFVLLGTVWARMCHSGVITLRSQVWAMNYPRSQRARISGRFATVGILIMAVVGTGLGLSMTLTTDLVALAPVINTALGLPAWATDFAILLSDQAYRVLLPIFAVMGGIGIALLGKVRVRRERAELVRERTGEISGRPPMNPWSLIRICLDDTRYGLFMVCQFFLGSGNMMAMAVLVITLRERFLMGYEAVLVTHALPLFAMTLTIPFWARYLDRTDIIRFRAVHSWVFVVMFALLVAGVAMTNLWLVSIASVIRGIAFGGGALAWNLGHHDLAPKDRASQYMSVHVTLTGVRGLLMPLLGVWLYNLLAGTGFEPGSWVFVLCLVLVFIGTVGFVWMDRAGMAGTGVVEASAPGVDPILIRANPPAKARSAELPHPTTDNPGPRYTEPADTTTR